MLRVITGIARGRKLETVEGLHTRPTSDQTKESLFNAIAFDIEGRRVLDLFAGTGQLGIEALSRGAKDAVFIDASAAPIKVIRRNVEKTGFADVSEVIQSDWQAGLARFRADRFGLIFIDPPYESGLLHQSLRYIMEKNLLQRGGLIVCEGLREDKPLPECPKEYRIYREYNYGKTKLTIVVREAASEPQDQEA